MVLLSLKIFIKQSNATKTMQFEPSCVVYDACRLIREKTAEAHQGQAQDYGLFLSDKDPKKGVWLESRRPLEYYLLRDGDVLEYKLKFRPLKVRTLDDSVKTIMIDDASTVDQVMVAICTRLGISNHDEYSLARETQEEENSDVKKDGTLLKSGTADRRFETLKKKLHTDDELKWLHHGHTLREQGVTETEILILRRKYFYSDQNIDSRDPIQLNLLYVQSLDGILKGQYPINEQDAITFAALQCQIQLGAHDEKKHKPGYLDLKDYLPKEYVKSRGIEKKIFQDHKELASLSELDAKARYTKNCRALKTYGVSFFLVKEKMKGKNKLVPRLLGITRESVMRLDERTKDTLKVWPLTSVKRWAASPKSFTLDFGDYQDGYYSVQTTEGEQIAQLIAGYIDIILKKRAAEDNEGTSNDDDAIMVEDVVATGRGHVIGTHGSSMGSFHSGSLVMPGVIGSQGGNASNYSMGSMQASQVTTSGSIKYGGKAMNSSQKALFGNISTSQNACRAAMEGFSAHTTQAPLGNDAASKQWRMEMMNEGKYHIGSNLSAIDAAAAALILGTSGETDFYLVNSNISTITSNLNDMARGLHEMASLMDDVGAGNLMKAAKDLASSINDLLQGIRPGNEDQRRKALEAAGKIADASRLLYSYIGEEVDQPLQDSLMNMAKQVASATSALMMQAKMVASRSADSDVQKQVTGSATQCAVSTSELVTCSKVLAPSIGYLGCYDQMNNSVNSVSQAVDNFIGVTQLATNDPSLLDSLNQAAFRVKNALDDLMNQVQQGTSNNQNGGKYDEHCEVLLQATDKLCNSLGEAAVMVKQAKLIAQTASQLVGMLKLEADETGDDDLRNRLLGAAKLLADATGKMVEAARGAAGKPNDSQQQQNLKDAAENLLATTNTATQNALRKKLLDQLLRASLQAVSASTQVGVAVHTAESSNTNKATQHQLNANIKNTQQEHIPRLLRAIREFRDSPDASAAQQNLISAAGDFVAPCVKTVSLSKAVVPTVTDQGVSAQLASSSKLLASAASALKSASSRAANICAPSGISAALENVEALQRVLLDHCSDARDGLLQPLPDENMKQCAQELGSSAKVVAASMAQFLTAASQKNEDYTGLSALDLASALRSVAGASRGVAAHFPDLNSKLNLLEKTGEVMNRAVDLLNKAESMLAESGSSQADLTQAARAVSRALNECVSCLPGQKEIDDALKSVGRTSKQLLSAKLPASTSNYQSIQSQLKQAAEGLGVATNDLSFACRERPEDLAAASSVYKVKFGEVIDAGLQMAGQWKDKEDQVKVVDNLKSISMASSKLLLASKSLSADPGASNIKNQLSAAARAVTESINLLMSHCMQSKPGQRECENLLRQIESAKAMIANPNDPLNDLSYFECLENIMDNSKSLANSTSALAQHARANELDKFGGCVTSSESALMDLIEATAQAAYLVGVADPNSEAGVPGLVDQSQFARANQAVQLACQDIMDQEATSAQMLSAAAVVAKHTSALCNVCRVASNKTNNAVAKKHFIQSAKEIAQTTGDMVQKVKAANNNFSKGNRDKCAQGAVALAEAVESLTAFVSNPEFASVPAKISYQGCQAQQPIIKVGQQLLDCSSDLIKTAEKLSNQPKHPLTHQAMSNKNRLLADAIKRLVSAVKENAPGQKECDEAIEAINSSIKQLDDASLLSMDQSLPTHTDNTLQGYQSMVVAAVNQISACVDATETAAKSDALLLGRQVAQIASYIDPLTSATIGAASNCPNHLRQTDILDYSKTLAESILQLIYCAKEGGGNPKAISAHGNIAEAAQGSRDAIQELLKSAQEAPEAITNGLVDTIDAACRVLTAPINLDDDDTFAKFQTRIAARCRAILAANSDITMAANNRPEELGELAQKLTDEYTSLAGDGAGLAAIADSDEVSEHIRKTIEALGEACKTLVTSCGEVQGRPRDFNAKKRLKENAKNLKEKVSYVMSSMQQGGRGTQACINAHTQLQGIIGDLDTTIMFATTGALNAEADGGAFPEHREVILKEAKILVEHTKKLVSSATRGQEELASSVQESSSSIASLVDAIKLGAVSLGSEDPDTQTFLLNAVRDVTSTLSDLINASKNASGKSANDASMLQLKSSAKSMVSSVTSLLKTVKSVDDEASKGTRALEQTIASIKQETKLLNSTDPEQRRGTPEELIRATKPITNATAKAVAAGKSGRQEDMVACANLGRKTVHDMVEACKAAAASADSNGQKESILSFCKSVTESYEALLSNVLATNQQPTDQNLKQKLIPLSKSVATAVSNLVRAGEDMKGADWVDPNDPNVIAEQELLAAAASIEAAAKKLALLRPRKKLKQVDTDLNFEEQILEAAKSIATATTALVKAASAAQKELVQQGKVGAEPAMRNDDGQWSQGLISAAQLVARSTGNLCEAANQAVQGDASEEKLITSAKQVASSTAQLLVACQVKADPNSENMKRLQTAGNAVKKAAQSLVDSAKEAAAFQEPENEEFPVSSGGGLVGTIRDEMEAMEKILAKEKELKEAQAKLKRLREKKYQQGPKPTPPPGKSEAKRRMEWPPKQ